MSDDLLTFGKNMVCVNGILDSSPEMDEQRRGETRSGGPFPC